MGTINALYLISYGINTISIYWLYVLLYGKYRNMYLSNVSIEQNE